MSKRERLTTIQCKAVVGHSNSLSTHPIEQAITEANRKEDERKKTKPTRQELASRLAANQAGKADLDQIVKILENKLPRPAGRPADDANALVARDLLVYIEYSKLLGNGHPRLYALRKAGKPWGLSVKSVESAITRFRKTLIK